MNYDNGCDSHLKIIRNKRSDLRKKLTKNGLLNYLFKNYFDVMKEFSCTQCGKCCQDLDKRPFPIAKVLNRGDGICRFLNDSNLCTIYELRPLICRVKETHEVFFSDKFEWNQFADLITNECERLKKT